MKKDLISIVIPVYNVEKYLKRCLDSIINQTHKNLEIICVDDGSIDSSGKILDDYKNKDKRIKVYHIKNGGVSHARNVGIKHITGNYVGFIDPDDFIETNMYEELYNSIIENNSDVSVCNNYIYYEENDSIEKVKYSDSIPKIMSKTFYLDKMFKDNYNGYVWNRLYKVKYIKKVKFDESIIIMEDVIFNIDYASNINKISFVDIPLYYYVMRATSAVHKENNKRNQNLFVAKEIIDKKIEKYNLDSQTQLRLNYIVDAQFYLYTKNVDLEEKEKIRTEIKKYLKDKVLIKKGHYKFKLKAVFSLLFPKLYVKIRYR